MTERHTRSSSIQAVFSFAPSERDTGIVMEFGDSLAVLLVQAVLSLSASEREAGTVMTYLEEFAFVPTVSSETFIFHLVKLARLLDDISQLPCLRGGILTDFVQGNNSYSLRDCTKGIVMEAVDFWSASGRHVPS